MAASFRQWESDPLFSAAEVVQDSADRMDSIFRMLLNEHNLVQGATSDPLLLSSIELHRLDLVTALGTTRWQLEDFERAVNLSALLDKSHQREDAIFRHKQFIGAIREQVIHVEKILEDPSIGDSKRNLQWVNLNEQDRDGLTLFLSGGSPVGHHARYDSDDSSIMRRFLGSTIDSAYDAKSDEIVELKTENVEDSKMNGVMHLACNFDSLLKNKLRKAGSHYSMGLGIEASISLQKSTGDRVGEGGSGDLKNYDSNHKSFFSKNKLRGLHNRLDVLWSLGNFWSAYRSKMALSSLKKREDGEVGTKFDERASSSYLDIAQVEQGRHTQMGLASGFKSSRELCFMLLTNTIQSYIWLGSCRRGLQRSPYFIQVNQLPVRLISVIFVTLIVLVVLGFQVA